jgi:hypothetical protein
LTTTFVRGEPVTVVSLAQLPGRKPTPAPPGVAAFPKPGQVYLSPALAELAHRLPARQLADRFPKTAFYETIGAAGLAGADEVVGVGGVEAGADRAAGDAEFVAHDPLPDRLHALVEHPGCSGPSRLPRPTDRNPVEPCPSLRLVSELIGV